MAGLAAGTKAAVGRSRLPFALVSLLLHVIVLLAVMAFRAPVIEGAETQLEVVLLHEDLKTPPLVPAVVAESNASGGGFDLEERTWVPLERARNAEEVDGGFARTVATAPADGDLTAAGAGAGAAGAAGAAGGAGGAAAGTGTGTGAAAAAAAVAGATGAGAGAGASPRAGEDVRADAREAPGIDAPSAAAARPKRLTYGIDAVGASYARYVRNWTARIEQLGTDHYPTEARGRLYDSLIITVEIDRHGEVVDIVINRPSQHEALNRAVRRLVLAGAPYAPFTPEMAREGDVLRIVRTWTFTNGMLDAAGASRT